MMNKRCIVLIGELLLLLSQFWKHFNLFFMEQCFEMYYRSPSLILYIIPVMSYELPVTLHGMEVFPHVICNIYITNIQGDDYLLGLLSNIKTKRYTTAKFGILLLVIIGYFSVFMVMGSYLWGVLPCYLWGMLPLVCYLCR
jgi:hypothetical protein